MTTLHNSSAATLINQFQGRSVAVIGDVMLDQYVWGKATRISQEAPVPVVAVSRTTHAPGGAANVMRNLATLGAAPMPFAVLGSDPAGDTLTALLEPVCPVREGLLRIRGRRTTEKTRVIAGNQQVVRIDVEDTAPLDSMDAALLLEYLRRACVQRRVEAIIVEDYAKGLVTRALLEEVVAIATPLGIPVALDPHPGNRANVHGLSVITPNRPEAFALAGAYYTEGRDDLMADTPLLEVAHTLENLWAPESLLITLGAHGMALFKEGAPALHVPTKAREVFDVSGAGDTVIATYTLALLVGAPPEDAAIIANHAAGVVVGKIGTAPIHAAELLASFDINS